MARDGTRDKMNEPRGPRTITLTLAGRGHSQDTLVIGVCPSGVGGVVEGPGVDGWALEEGKVGALCSSYVL